MKHRVHTAWLILGGLAVIASIIGAGLGIAAFVRVNNGSSSPSTAAASISAAGKPSSPPPPPAVLPTEQCDVLIIGAGAGGLTMLHRLAPKLGSKVCVVDDRAYFGGKVHSVKSAKSTEAKPIYGVTHAEQLRGGDAIVRCMMQEFGSPTVKRGTVGRYSQNWQRGQNITAFQCVGVDPPAPGTPGDCDWGNPYEVTAPNGPLADQVWNSSLMTPACTNKDWTECSYEEEYYTLLASPSNAGTITNGETWTQYCIRILGEESCAYLKGITFNAEGWDAAETSARYFVDYLNYDYWDYPYGHVTMIQGGPQVAIWNKVALKAQNLGARTFLNEKVLQVNSLTGAGQYVYAAKTALGRTFQAKRLVLAIPADHVRDLTGTIATRLQQTPYVQYTSQVHVCSLNMYFATKWWLPRSNQCTLGYCAAAKAYNVTSQARTYIDFVSYADEDDEDSFSFLQYEPTPERQLGNYVRAIFEENPCRTFDGMTPADVKDEMMRRMRITQSDLLPIPEPTEYHYASERTGYSNIRAGATFRAAALIEWAAEPLPGEKICFATESFNPLDSGWQEGAARTAHNCLRGNVFKDMFTTSQVTAFERCAANVTGGSNRVLSVTNKNSGNDLCLLLNNEYAMRDLAGYAYCGGRATYGYPTNTQLTSLQTPSNIPSANTIIGVYEDRPGELGHRGHL